MSEDRTPITSDDASEPTDRDWSVLEVRVHTRNADQVLNLGEDLAIDYSDINQSFIDQPAKFAWWATVCAQARAIYEHSKEQVERYEDFIKQQLIGELDAKMRTKIELDGGKVTESKVEKAIYASDEYKAAIEQLNDMRDSMLKAQENYSILYAARQAMDQRKDMLISLGAQLRQEVNNTSLSLH